MTLTTTHNRLAYVGNGSTTVFPYTFLITATADLRVYHDDVRQTLGFTVSGVGVGGGGTVTYSVAPATGVEIVFLRYTDQTQQVDLIEGDRLPAEAVEGMFDKVYAVAQDLAERLNRTVRIPPTSEAAEDTVFLPDPADPANQDKAIFINADGQLEMRAILSTDIASPITAPGDLIRGSSSGAPQRLPIGTAGQLLTVVAGQAAWATPSASGIQATLFDAKGDLLGASANDTPVRVPVGVNGTLLSADSTQATGLAYIDPQTLPGAKYSTYTEIADPAVPATTTVRTYVPTGLTGLRRLRGQDSAGQRSDYTAIPAHLRFTGNPYKDVVSTSAETSIFGTPPTVYAGTLGTDRALRLTLLGDVLSNAGATRGFTLRFKYGATTWAVPECVGTLAVSATRRGWRAVALLAARGSPSAQMGYAEFLVGSVGVSGVATVRTGGVAEIALYNSLAENSATDLALNITIQPDVSHANLSVRVFVVLGEWL